MQHVWDNIQEIEKKIKQHKILLLMLDFDGTLSPLAPHPKKAVLSREMKSLLEKLIKRDNLFLAIISGRPLDALKEKVGITQITYSGSHGFEEEVFGKIDKYQLTATQKNKLEKLKEQLENLSKKYDGAWVEDKGVMLVVHYRLVAEEEKANVRKTFDAVMQKYMGQKTFFVIYGKNVFEVKPTNTVHKGTFAKKLIKKIKEKTKTTLSIIYIGDDATDEDVFRELRNAITVRVGPAKESVAKYSLTDNNTEDVFHFLTWLDHILPSSGR